MGDRVVIVCYDQHGPAPAIYAHWMGHEAPTIVKTAGDEGILRKGDSSYAAARLCGWFCQQDAGSALGVGLLDAPKGIEDQDFYDISQGDAGTIAINVDDGTVRYFGGYHASNSEGLPTQVKLAND